eukprot:639653_1
MQCIAWSMIWSPCKFWTLLFSFITITISKKPNIIFIISDDLGYNDLYYQSHQINTPSIDKFVSEGQFLEWHYAQSICSPSRAALMTGRYPLHTGINDWIQPTQAFGVPLNNTMLPKILYNNGYDTHMVGKWHLGMFQWKYTPTYRGYKSFYGYYGGGEDYYTHKTQQYYDFRNDVGIHCGANCSSVEIDAYQNYSAPLFSQRAVEIITNHSTNPETKDTPLFLYLAYQSVHSPAQCPAQWVEPYVKTINNTKRRLFAGMVSCMDEGIGNVTRALEQYGYLGDNGNTIVIMSSDNGGPTTTGDGIGSSNYPLRGGKHSIWEGGTRVTAWLWATPDIIDRSVATIGKNYTQLMHLVDWMPTILEAANINYTFPSGLELDGVSHWKGLTTGNSFEDKYFHFRNDVYYGYDDFCTPKNVAYRYQWYKIFNSTGGNPNSWSPKGGITETVSEYGVCSGFNGDLSSIPLYNLSDDYAERHDISQLNEDLVTELVHQMHVFQATGVPQASSDKNCPNITHSVYPVVGKVWEPWCG